MIPLSGLDIATDETLVDDADPGATTKTKNVDLAQEGAASVRDGKVRTTFHVTFTALGPTTRSLIPVDIVWGRHFLLACSDGTLRMMRNPDPLVSE
jgi:hypothetical protein